MLTEKQKKHLRGLAHSRHPIVRVGTCGVTDAVIKELDRTLEHHELVKIKIETGDRGERRNIVARLADSCQAEAIHAVGKTAVLFRQNERETRIVLP